MAFLVGVDIGGTFTDACAVSTRDGAVYTAKARSTPDDLIAGLVDSLILLAEEAGLTVEELLLNTLKFAHGTTQTSNVMMTWMGARTGLITTKGFADEILIMRARGRVAGLPMSARRHLRTTDKPPRIVPRTMIEEVAERTDHRGRVLVPLSEQEAARAVDALLAKDAKSIAVSLLWSPQNPSHELLLERVIRERAPHIQISLSHRLAPIVGEYERTATAVVNAFVGPTVSRYIERLTTTLEGLGLRVPVLVVQCNGGVSHVQQTVPVNTIESGPAAGMVAAKALADAMGHQHIVATDVGGTTFKVGLLVNSEWSMASETIVNQYSLLVPMIDLISIGAGGGSIAWVDDRRLRIGPQSAGADPGPACYGWGGTEPTVTDADLVLGFLNPRRFLGGRLRLNPELAHSALRRIADPLFHGDVVQAAAGIRKVVDAQMGDLIHKATIERGYDPRSFVMMSYGGAGPLHAAGYAKGFGVRTIIVPEAATAYSAYGAAASDIQHSLQQSVSSGIIDNHPELEAAYANLEEEAKFLLERQGVRPPQTRIARWADMRYERQLHDIRVYLPESSREDAGVQWLRDAFERRYAALYGDVAILRNARLQLLRIGVEAIGLIAKPEINTLELKHYRPSVDEARPVFWPEAQEWIETPTFNGIELHPGAEVLGPAVIEHPGTTIAVPIGATASVDQIGNTVIILGDRQI